MAPISGQWFDALKPEFDKRKCIKDGVDGKWHFADE